MNTVKMIALDLDGTLIPEDQRVSLKDRAAIRRAQQAGVPVIIATGRLYPSARAWLSKLASAPAAILCNGADVREEGKSIYSDAINPKHLAEAYRAMGDFETKRYVYCGDKIYCTKNDYDEILFHKWGKSALESGLVQYRGSLEEILESVGGGAMKFVASTENDSRHPEIAAVARNLGYFDVVRGEALHFEFTRKGVNKGKALRSVAAKMGISMQNVLAVGDSMNDYEMIRAAGMGVAMGNAMDDVKRIADAITLPVWESGVACAISRYVFGENEEPQGGENAQ